MLADQQVHKVGDPRFAPILHRQLNLRNLRLGEHQPHVPLKLAPHSRRRLTALHVPDGELHQDLVQRVPAAQMHRQRRRDALLVPVQIVARQPLVGADLNLAPEGFDRGVRREGAPVLEIRRLGDGAFEQRDGDDVLHAVVAVRGVEQGPGLVDDHVGRGAGADLDPGDVGRGVEAAGPQLRALRQRRFDGGDAVALDRHHFEKNVLNHPRRVRFRERELGAAAPGRGVEAPARHAEDGRGAGLAAAREEGKLHGAHAGVARGPALAGDGVGAGAVDAQGGDVHPDVGNGRHGFILAEAQEPGDHGRRGEFDEDGVVEAVRVEGVAEEKAALDLVDFDDRRDECVHGHWRTGVGQPAAGR